MARCIIDGKQNMSVIIEWFRQKFQDPQVVVFLVLLIILTGFIVQFGAMLTPVLASIVIAYLLEGLIRPLNRYGMPRPAAVGLVYVTFIGFVLFCLIMLVPMVSRQFVQLVQQLPSMIVSGYQTLESLPQRYPAMITPEQLTQITRTIQTEITNLSQHLVSWSLTSVVSVITIVVYLVLLPLLVFFFLKDKQRILAWAASFLPSENRFLTQVWQEVDRQLGNYIRGKFWEILIVSAVTWAVFASQDLQFAALLGLMVGLSVIVPFVGAAVVTIPVAMVAFFQWGLSGDFMWLMISYGIIQILDGNVLVPLLFSEAVNLHPIAIIVAVLFFGGIWGFWGIFFAIPLATVVSAVANTWHSSPPLQVAEEAHTPAL